MFHARAMEEREKPGSLKPISSRVELDGARARSMHLSWACSFSPACRLAFQADGDPSDNPETIFRGALRGCARRTF